MNPSVSIFAAIAAMLSWGFGDFLIQKATRNVGDMEALAWIGLIGTIALIPFVRHDLALVFVRSNFLILLLLGVITFVIGIVNFEALKRGKISVIEVILEIELPIAVLLGVFFFHESLSLLQILLTALVFFGIVLIATESGKLKTRHFFEKGVSLALVAAIGYGLIDFLTAVGAKTISPLLTVWFTWVTFTVICLTYIIAQKGVRKFFVHALKQPSLIIGMGIIDTLAWIFFALAVKHNELAITVAISESYPAIGLMLGVAVNKEKVTRHQYIGAVIAVAASFLMGMLMR